MHKDIRGIDLQIGDEVAACASNGMVTGTVVAFTPKCVRVQFDENKYSWAISYAFKYGIKKGQIPTILVGGGSVVKLNPVI